MNALQRLASAARELLDVESLPVEWNKARLELLARNKRLEEALAHVPDPDPEPLVLGSIEKARALYGSDDIEVDNNAQISVNDEGGVWVQAWVYLYPSEEEEE